MPRTRLANFLNACRRVLGQHAVCCNPEDLRSAEQTTFITNRTIQAIVQPHRRVDLIELMRLANRYRVPLYPISRGRNWGLGSKVPAADGCVLVELHRLNRIVAFDERLAYITVEPGVTFQQVATFLSKRRSKLFLSVTGGPPDASVIGNVVERGTGLGPYGERLTNACGFEVVLPQGEVIRTGFGRFPNAKTAPLDRYGLGPSLDGLFTQSNLGIVTEMTMWLIPKPADFRIFSLVVNQRNMPRLVDAIQSLSMRGILQDHCFSLWNAKKTKAIYGDEIFTEGATESDWFGSGALYSASREEGRAKQKLIRQALEEWVMDLSIINDQRHPQIRQTKALGVPDHQHVWSVYGAEGKRSSTRIPNPDRDQCGFLWLCLAVPFRGVAVKAILEVLKKTRLPKGIQMQVGATLATPRLLHFHIALVYDRKEKGMDARAMTLHDRLLTRCIKQGYYPYRLGIQSMKILSDRENENGLVRERIKTVLDPNCILSPGRYKS